MAYSDSDTDDDKDLSKKNVSKEEAEPAENVDVLPYENNVKKGYVPEGFDDVDEFLQEMRDNYRDDLEFDRYNREQALDDKRFASGDQWDPKVLEIRKGLPCLVINTVPQFTAQLVGDWRQSRNAVKVIPSENGDVDIADIRGDLVRSIEWKSRADRVYDSAFESTVVGGDGAFRIAIEYAKDDVFDQDIFIRPIEDSQAVVWDRSSIDPTGRDATRCFVDDLIPIKEFKRKWPKVNPSHMNDEERRVLRNTGWIEDNSYRVTEYWQMIERERLLCLFTDGSVHICTKENQDKLIAQHGHPVRSRIAPCLYAQMHLVTGFEILAGPFEYKLNRLPIIRMTGRVINVAGERIRYGLVRFMKDPVRLRNFWRSVAAEQLGYAPKAQWLASESAVEGREDAFRKAHLSRDPLLVYNDGAETPPQRIEPPAVQAALLQESQVNVQDMKDITGIHDASLGIKSNETSGKAIMARQKEGDIASITFFDNGNASILEGGDVINQLIPQIYDGTRTVRLIGDDEEVKLQRINDPNDPSSPNLAVGQYDVALTTGTSYSTRRAEAADAMMQAVQVWPNLIQVAGDIIAKAQDWPGADKLAERLQKTIPPQYLSDEEKKEIGGDTSPQIDPQQVQQAMMKMQALEQENAQMKADRTIQEKKLLVDAYNAETQRIRALSDNQVDGNQMEMDALHKILDHQLSVSELDQQADQADKAHQLATQQAQAQQQAAQAAQSQSAASSNS